MLVLVFENKRNAEDQASRKLVMRGSCVLDFEEISRGFTNAP